MLRFSGELVSFVDMLSFENKNELLEKMKQVREEIKILPPNEREVFRKNLSVAVQQIYYTSNEKLLKFKSYLTKIKNNN